MIKINSYCNCNSMHKHIAYYPLHSFMLSISLLISDQERDIFNHSLSLLLLVVRLLSVRSDSSPRFLPPGADRGQQSIGMKQVCPCLIVTLCMSTEGIHVYMCINYYYFCYVLNPLGHYLYCAPSSIGTVLHPLITLLCPLVPTHHWWLHVTVPSPGVMSLVRT